MVQTAAVVGLVRLPEKSGYGPSDASKDEATNSNGMPIARKMAYARAVDRMIKAIETLKDRVEQPIDLKLIADVSANKYAIASSCLHLS